MIYNRSESEESTVIIEEEPPEKTWWELHGTEVVAGVLLLGLGIGIPAILIAKKRRRR